MHNFVSVVKYFALAGVSDRPIGRARRCWLLVLMAGVAKRGAVVFYYDIVCPYTYLAAHRILGLTKHPGAAHVEVQWKPVLLGALYKVLSRQPPVSRPRGGNLAIVDLSTVAFRGLVLYPQATHAPQGKDGSASDVMNPAKRTLAARDLMRQAERANVPLVWNSHHPARSLNALRLILSAPESRRVEVSMALYKYVAHTDHPDSAST